MRKSLSRFLYLSLIILICGFQIASGVVASRGDRSDGDYFSLCVQSEAGQKKLSESWMGVYMNGVKVGYSRHQEWTLSRNGQKLRKEIDESRMAVSRLGAKPVELVTVQESLYDENSRPLECRLRVKMSEKETVLAAEVVSQKILFRSGERIIKELPFEGEFFLATPIQKIIAEGGWKPGHRLNFNLLDMTTSSLVRCRLEVLGREDVLILGERKSLWRVRQEIDSVIAVVNDEWLDEKGKAWKSISRTSLADLTSLRMSKEKALEVSEKNFDIAFSTVVRPNIAFADPLKIRRMTFKLSGFSSDRISRFPFDEESQKLLETGENYALIQTRAQIFREEQAIQLPVEDQRFEEFLRPTLYCESDDPAIRKAAARAVGEEKNAWRAAKKIAEWVNRELVASYDVGFASAREVLETKKGDCSEYTVLMIALCRAVGMPARAAVGLMSAQGIFAYHMWPEVYVGRWIGLDPRWLAVDTKSGEYYTDATHIKLGHTPLDENIFKEIAQAISEIVGRIQIEIVGYYPNN